MGTLHSLCNFSTWKYSIHKDAINKNIAELKSQPLAPIRITGTLRSTTSRDSGTHAHPCILQTTHMGQAEGVHTHLGPAGAGHTHWCSTPSNISRMSHPSCICKDTKSCICRNPLQKGHRTFYHTLTWEVLLEIDWIRASFLSIFIFKKKTFFIRKSDL